MKWSEFQSYPAHEMFSHVWKLHMSDMYVKIRDEQMKESVSKLFMAEVVNTSLDTVYPNEEVFLSEQEAQAQAALRNGPLWKIHWSETDSWPERLSQEGLFCESWRYEDGLFTSAKAAARWIELLKTQPKEEPVKPEDKFIRYRTSELADIILSRTGRHSKVHWAAQVSTMISQFNIKHFGKISMPGKYGHRRGYGATASTWHRFFSQFNR